jgi:hypothetical protein
MSHTSDKFKKWVYNKLFGDIDKEKTEAINQAIAEERKWVSARVDNKITSFIEAQSDPFYAKFPERDTDYKFKELEHKYIDKDKKKKLLERGTIERAQLVKTIEATGWTPTGFENASFRIGSIDELSAIQDACFKKYMLDPLGKSIVMNMQFFTVGKGVKVSSVSEEVDKWLKEFRNLNDMGKREKKMVRSAYIEGEYFLVYVKEGEKVHLRKVAPYRVREIETKDDDIESINRYLITRIDQSSEYWVKDAGSEVRFSNSLLERDLSAKKYIQFIKYGEEEYLRGQPPMYSILRYLRHYEDWLVDRMRLNHERAKVVWIRTLTGTTGTKPDSPFIAPKGGIILEENPTLKYRIESAKLDSDDAKEDGLAILYAVGAGIQMPLHVLTQITSEQVYASIRKSDTPFSQMIESNQDMWREEWDRMYRFSMRLSGKFNNARFKVPYYPDEARYEAMSLINRMIVDKRSEEEIIKEAKKVLDRKGGKKINATIDDVPITQVFPDVVHEDPLSVAKALLIHHKMQIVSNQTAAERAGYNWQEELAKMKAEEGQLPQKEEGEPGGKEGPVPGFADDTFGDTGGSGIGEPQI